jgi:hypothetical protein
MIQQIPETTQNKILGAWFLATLVTFGVYIGGIADQLRFGSKIW